jgi:hypothetical protein
MAHGHVSASARQFRGMKSLLIAVRLIAVRLIA